MRKRGDRERDIEERKGKRERKRGRQRDKKRHKERKSERETRERGLPFKHTLSVNVYMVHKIQS